MRSIGLHLFQSAIQSRIETRLRGNSRLPGTTDYVAEFFSIR
jgi:hypothetical protein